MSSPKFSILMPVVKTRYFREAFDSAATQTFDDYEIIVVDNKADADVSWVQENPKTKFFRNPTQLPMVENWNFALSKATGEYVLLLSDDDLISRDCLSTCAEEISRRTITVARLGRIDINNEGIVLSYSCPGSAMETADEFIYNMFRYQRSMCLVDVLFNRECLISIGKFPVIDLGWGADQLAAYKIALKHNAIAHFNKKICLYRTHQGNTSTSTKNNSIQRKFAADIKWRSELIEEIKKNPKSVYSEKATEEIKKSMENCFTFQLITLIRERMAIKFLRAAISRKTSISNRKRLLCCIEAVLRSIIFALEKAKSL